jgi:hypothetical protein
VISGDLLAALRGDQANAKPGLGLVFGTVAAVSSQTATVTFDGETTTSTRYYPALYSYAPTVGHRVALLVDGGTRLIIGRV